MRERHVVPSSCHSGPALAYNKLDTADQPDDGEHNDSNVGDSAANFVVPVAMVATVVVFVVGVINVLILIIAIFPVRHPT